MLCRGCGTPKRPKGKLVQRDGKFGKFYGCSRYPNCRHTEQLTYRGPAYRGPEQPAGARPTSSQRSPSQRTPFAGGEIRAPPAVRNSPAAKKRRIVDGKVVSTGGARSASPEPEQAPTPQDATRRLPDGDAGHVLAGAGTSRSAVPAQDAARAAALARLTTPSPTLARKKRSRRSPSRPQQPPARPAAPTAAPLAPPGAVAQPVAPPGAVAQPPALEELDAAREAVDTILCSPPELARPSLRCLSSILKNILADLFEPKYRQLRLSNARIQAGVVDVEGALPFLLSAGFRLTSAPGLPPSPAAAAAAAAGQDGPQVLLLRQGDEFQVRVQKPFVRVDLTEAWFVAQLAQHLEMLRGAAGRLAALHAPPVPPGS